MPLDASDRTRKIQEITLFTGYAIQKQFTQPRVNVSTCSGFYNSTLQNYTTYEYKTQIDNCDVGSTFSIDDGITW